MVRVLVSLWLALSVSACLETFPPDDEAGGDGGSGCAPGWCGTSVDPHAPPVLVGTPVRLLDEAGLTSHALAPAGADVVVVATKDLLSPDGAKPAVTWTLLDAAGQVEPARPVELYGSETGRLRLGAVAVGGTRVFLAMANEEALITHEFALASGASITGGSSGGSGAPDLPLRPSAVAYPPGFFSISNGWYGAISASVSIPWEFYGYDGFYAGFDPYVVRAGDDAWLGWNDTSGAAVARLEGSEPPMPTAPIALGAAANGPVLAAGPGAVLALTWGDTLEAHLVSLAPPALVVTTAVTAGPIAGRPAALPWDGGFLVLWADPAGTVVRGRLLDGAGQPRGDGFEVLRVDAPISLEPTHAVGDADGAWLSYETADGLEAVPLARATLQ
jgi:hypothetical protein